MDQEKHELNETFKKVSIKSLAGNELKETEPLKTTQDKVYDFFKIC